MDIYLIVVGACESTIPKNLIRAINYSCNYINCIYYLPIIHLP